MRSWPLFIPLVPVLFLFFLAVSGVVVPAAIVLFVGWQVVSFPLKWFTPNKHPSP